MQGKKKYHFELNTVLQRNPNQVFSVIDDEVVLLSIENSSYFNINRSGSDIWETLAIQTTYSELIRHLTNIYNISEEDCIREINEFLTESIKLGLIEIVNG